MQQAPDYLNPDCLEPLTQHARLVILTSHNACDFIVDFDVFIHHTNVRELKTPNVSVFLHYGIFSLWVAVAKGTLPVNDFKTVFIAYLQVSTRSSVRSFPVNCGGKYANNNRKAIFRIEHSQFKSSYISSSLMAQQQNIPHDSKKKKTERGK